MDFLSDFRAYVASYNITLPNNLLPNAPFSRTRFDPENGSTTGSNKKGWYTIHLNGDSAWAVCGVWGGDKIPAFFPKNQKQTPEIKQQTRKVFAEIKKEQEKKQKECIKKSKKLWEMLVPAAASHPYLAKKQVQPHNALQDKDGTLYIPLYQGTCDIEGLVSFQKIWADGTKNFETGTILTGSFCTIGEVSGTICLLEGWATASTVHQETGYMVYVAFNAGNLPNIAAIIRALHPEAIIIIGADNDHWDKKTGLPRDPSKNTGQIKGREAAAKCGGIFKTVPVIEEPLEDGSHITDFNDLAIAWGGQAVRDILMAEDEEKTAESAPIPDEPIPDEMPDDIRGNNTPPWQERLLLTDKKTGEIKINTANTLTWLQQEERLQGVFGYNEFSHEKMIIKCPPWEKKERFRPRPVQDTDYTRLTAFLDEQDYCQTVAMVTRCANAVIEESSYHPVKDYFNALKWDGNPRLHSWLYRYCGANGDDAEYVSAVGTRWLVAGAARIFEPGVKFDSMLILEGEQNMMKSLLLKELSTLNGQEYFYDGLKLAEFGNDKAVPKLQGNLIVEFQEMSGLSVKDVDELKTAISLQKDKLQKKYENEITVYNRQFILAGTINPTGNGYLQDETGNRRFWPVRVTQIDMEALKADKDQLWAEAVHLYKHEYCSGRLKLYLEDTLYRKASAAQAERMYEHPWHEEIEKFARGKQQITSAQIWEHLEINDRVKRNPTNKKAITRIMQTLGFTYGLPYIDGIRTRAWERKMPAPPPQQQYCADLLYYDLETENAAAWQ